MSQNGTTERLVVLVLIIAAVATAGERKQIGERHAETAAPRDGHRLPAVVPALGIRG